MMIVKNRYIIPSRGLLDYQVERFFIEKPYTDSIRLNWIKRFVKSMKLVSKVWPKRTKKERKLGFDRFAEKSDSMGICSYLSVL